MAREIYGRKVYFAVPGFSLEPSDVVIDLGANVGVFTILAARLASKVVAVEAQSKFTSEILVNLKNNNCSADTNVEFGLVGPRSGLFSEFQHLKAASHFEEMPGEISMNELIKNNNIDRINFLKIDIEGSEFDLFKENIDWLSRVEKIAMEVHLEFGDQKILVDLLKGKGFDVWLVDRDQRIVETLTGQGGNLFAKRTVNSGAIV